MIQARLYKHDSPQWRFTCICFSFQKFIDLDHHCIHCEDIIPPPAFPTSPNLSAIRTCPFYFVINPPKKEAQFTKVTLHPLTTLVQPVCDSVRAYPVNDPMYTRDGKFHVFFSPFLQKYFPPFYANTVVVDVQRLIFDIPAMPKNCHDASWRVGHDGAVQQSVFFHRSDLYFHGNAHC